MKAKLLFNMRGPNPTFRYDALYEFLRTGKPQIGDAHRAELHQPKGTIIDNPRAFRLVQMGIAEPVDEDCRRRANMTPETFSRAQYAYLRSTRGIHPDDFKLYDAGKIVGYNPDGSYKRGPNWTEEDEPSTEEDEYEDE